MSKETIVETVKEAVAGARSKAEVVGARSKDVLETGVQTLQAAKEVVVTAGRQAAEVLANTKDELKRTLKQGAAEVGDKLARIATATRKEQAKARKAEVKAKKRAKASAASSHAAAR